jgi:hypothetical protein
MDKIKKRSLCEWITHYRQNPIVLSPISNFLGFSTIHIFMGWCCRPHTQFPKWRNRESLFAYVITFDLSSMASPTSSNATASIAIRNIWPHKLNSYVTVGKQSVGRALSYSGPNILLSQVFRVFSSFLVNAQTSEPYITITLIIVR